LPAEKATSITFGRFQGVFQDEKHRSVTLEAGSPDKPPIFGKYLLQGLEAVASWPRTPCQAPQKGRRSLRDKAMLTKLSRSDIHRHVPGEGTSGACCNIPTSCRPTRAAVTRTSISSRMSKTRQGIDPCARKVHTRSALPFPVAFYIAQNSAEALHYAHTSPTRTATARTSEPDVSPTNIRFSTRRGQDHRLRIPRAKPGHIRDPAPSGQVSTCPGTDPSPPMGRSADIFSQGTCSMKSRLWSVSQGIE
jgi:hypothetical protein